MVLHPTPEQRFRLHETRDATDDADILRRALAILELDQGVPVAAVADQLGVTRQTIYNWLDRYLRARLRKPCAITAVMPMSPPGTRISWPSCSPRCSDRRCNGATVTRSGPSLCSASTWPVGMAGGGRRRPFAGSCTGRDMSGSGPLRAPTRPASAQKMSRIRRQLGELGPHIALLFEDETDLLLFPPLRACWARRGESAEVMLSGRNARRVLFGATHVRTGHRLLLPRRRQRAEDFQAFLQLIHDRYRGWPVWLLLDEDSSHTAHASVGLARELRIGLIWLPKRCPELNAMDHLWGHAKDEVCANSQASSIDHLIDSFVRYVQSLSPEEARKKAGILSEEFWLGEECQN